MRRRGQPIASSISGNGRGLAGRRGEPVEQLAHEVAAAVVEARDLVRVGQDVVGRVLDHAAASPSSRSTSTQSFHSPSSRPWRRWMPTSSKPAARWTARLAPLSANTREVSL